MLLIGLQFRCLKRIHFLAAAYDREEFRALLLGVIYANLNLLRFSLNVNKQVQKSCYSENVCNCRIQVIGKTKINHLLANFSFSFKVQVNKNKILQHFICFFSGRHGDCWLCLLIILNRCTQGRWCNTICLLPRYVGFFFGFDLEIISFLRSK